MVPLRAANSLRPASLCSFDSRLITRDPPSKPIARLLAACCATPSQQRVCRDRNGAHHGFKAGVEENSRQELKQAVATLTVESWNQLTGWLGAMNLLRQSMAGRAAQPSDDADSSRSPPASRQSPQSLCGWNPRIGKGWGGSWSLKPGAGPRLEAAAQGRSEAASAVASPQDRNGIQAPVAFELNNQVPSAVSPLQIPFRFRCGSLTLARNERSRVADPEAAH
jgi:hypothetical protein